MLILNIKYSYSGYQQDKVFHFFNNEVDYTLAYLFVESKITKCNMDKFLTNPLIKYINGQLLYQNIDK